MLFADLAATSERVRAASGRRDKALLIADALRRLAPHERAAGAGFLAGELRQRVLGAGWASLRELPPPAAEPSLTVADVDAAFGHVAAATGPGSQAARRTALGVLFGAATAAEQELLRALVAGDLRQGALAYAVVDAIARATGIPLASVRRALMLRGDLGAVAEIALGEGVAGLEAIRLQVGRPLQPMLASTAPDVDAALAKTGPAGVEWKLDGARIQVHRDDGDVAIFTRSLDDVTGRLPEVVEAALALPAERILLDGEAIALREDGRPHPFQVTGSRFGSRTNVEQLRRSIPLTPVMFDVLHLDGEDLIDRTGAERADALAQAVPAQWRVRRLVVETGAEPKPTTEPEASAAGRAMQFEAEPTTAPEAPAAGRAEQFMAEALAAGHEGVVLKSLAAPYAAGRRGAAWVKVKPRHTFDLVVLAAEWGHGRRRGWLSNLWLGARDGDGFVMLGKTFKGLTDAMLTWQTEQLLGLETGREGHVVHVRPELVVEIAFDGLQASRRYPGGVALRFARVLRHRPEKPAHEADTLDSVLAVAP